MHAYERWIARHYFANALKSRGVRTPSSVADIFDWIERHARSLGLPKLERPDESDLPKDKRDFRLKWTNWRTRVVHLASGPQPARSPLQERIDWIADACTLTASQRYVLGLHVRVAVQPQVFSLAAAINEELHFKSIGDAFGSAELRPLLAGRTDPRELSNAGLLVRLGLVDDRAELRLSEIANRIVREKRLRPGRIRDMLLGESLAASLSWTDFEHLGKVRDLAARIVEAHRNGEWNIGGPNLLFYGEPGTGKSEFAKTLGEHLGLSVRFVGETDESNAEPNRRERIAALMMAKALGAAAGGMLVVLDEADDLFAGVDEDDASTRHGSKVFMNRLVETSRTPTIWITNTLERLGPAVLRRMNLLVRFPNPGMPVRRRIVDRIAKRADFPLDEASATKLAQMATAPALIENAIAGSACIGGAASDAQTILECSAAALGCSRNTAATGPLPFDPELSAADVNLLLLADRVVRSPSRALSFCLSGPPGTGKSAYARYLAERLELETLEKRYSDLTSMWVGETEKTIAAAFQEAADLRAFLILDEADSLLRNRSAAHRSWEITQVNEMLTWMERHPLPFACTTNAPDLLDPATARRFLFKISFLPMTPAQIAATFRRTFGTEPPSTVLRLEGLAPGDFAVVARKAMILERRDPEQLVLWLKDELSAKPEARSRRIGF